MLAPYGDNGSGRWLSRQGNALGIPYTEDDPARTTRRIRVPSPGKHDLDRAGHVDFVGKPGRDKGPRDRRDGRLVEDDLTPGHRLIKRDTIEDAPLDERDAIAEWVQPRSEPGGEVVDDADLVTASQQAANQVVTDEPGTAGDQYPQACASTLNNAELVSRRLALAQLYRTATRLPKPGAGSGLDGRSEWATGPASTRRGVRCRPTSVEGEERERSDHA